MPTSTRIGFVRKSSDITEGIFVPKYYDPLIEARLADLQDTHRLVTLGELIDSGAISVHYGHDIGKHHYGLGDIPYVRTSDLASWEVVSAPKQTVSEETYEWYQEKQHVRAGDVLFVRDGLYLIGTAALITEHDLPLIHQSHLIRFRVAEGAGFSPSALVAALSTPVVRQQVRSKQFTAGIIDKIEDRYREIALPLPFDSEKLNDLSNRTEELISRRVGLREVLRAIPLWAAGEIDDPAEGAPRERPDALTDPILGFTRNSAEIADVFIPKYYDPTVAQDLQRLESDFELSRVDELVSRSLVEVTTGVEVGKLAYGRGRIPFVRTSDLADWELAGEPKHRISEELYESLRERVDVRADDILLVRDGTYLVGTSAILTASDAAAIYAGGLYKLRSLDHNELDPYLLLALLNLRVVKRQIRSKRFTRDIIDTLGRRLFELVLPVPRDAERRSEIARRTREVVEERVALRERAKQIALELEGAEATTGALDDDDPYEAVALRREGLRAALQEELRELDPKVTAVELTLGSKPSSGAPSVARFAEFASIAEVTDLHVVGSITVFLSGALAKAAVEEIARRALHRINELARRGSKEAAAVEEVVVVSPRGGELARVTRPKAT